MKQKNLLTGWPVIIFLLSMVAVYCLYQLVTFNFLRPEPYRFGAHAMNIYMHHVLNGCIAIMHVVISCFLLRNVITVIQTKNNQYAKEALFGFLTMLFSAVSVIFFVTFLSVLIAEGSDKTLYGAGGAIALIAIIAGYLAVVAQKRMNRFLVGKNTRAFKWAVAVFGFIFFVLAGSKDIADTQFYYPSKPAIGQSILNDYEGSAVKKFQSADGTELECIYLAAKGESKATVLYFHGNGGYAELYFPCIAWLLEQGYDIAILEYRGYRLSQGRPSRQGLHLDAVAFLKWAEMIFADQELVIFAHSLGANVAIDALASSSDRVKKRILALGLEGGFLSYRRTAESTLPDNFPLKAFFADWVVSEKYSAASNIADLQLPLFVLHGTKDKEVPFEQGEAIFDNATHCTPRWLMAIKHEITPGVHIDAFTNASYREKYRKMLLDFFEVAIR